jgi:hypothetical protein
MTVAVDLVTLGLSKGDTASTIRAVRATLRYEKNLCLPGFDARSLIESHATIRALKTFYHGRVWRSSLSILEQVVELLLEVLFGIPL